VVEGKHDGKNLGRIIFEILKEAVLLEKVSTGNGPTPACSPNVVILIVALDR
jgi:hypothetical protein